VTSSDLFDVQRRSPGEGKPKIIYVRDKRSTPHADA